MPTPRRRPLSHRLAAYAGATLFSLGTIAAGCPGAARALVGALAMPAAVPVVYGTLGLPSAEAIVVEQRAAVVAANDARREASRARAAARRATQEHAAEIRLAQAHLTEARVAEAQARAELARERARVARTMVADANVEARLHLAFADPAVRRALDSAAREWPSSEEIRSAVADAERVTRAATPEVQHVIVVEHGEHDDRVRRL